MNITQDEARSQFERAQRDWPFFDDVNSAHGLRYRLLHGVGSRETDLQNVRTDDGHGVFQLDDRYHEIPPGFDDDVRAQAEKAASMLAEFYAQYGDWLSACNFYNSGQTETEKTTGGDYGPDVLERTDFFATLS
jgi:hypothetical protein